MMIKLAARYPGYGWEHNQGYATRDHRDAIRAMGLTPFHRRSFLALQRTLAGDQLDLDLLGDPSASPATHELLERELVPVMADDAAFDLADLASLESGRDVAAGMGQPHLFAERLARRLRRDARPLARLGGRRRRGPHVGSTTRPRGLDAELYGRRMYELMNAYWPHGETDPDGTATTRDYSRDLEGDAEDCVLVVAGHPSRATLGSSVAATWRRSWLEVRAEFPGDLGVGGATLAASFIRTRPSTSSG